MMKPTPGVIVVGWAALLLAGAGYAQVPQTSAGVGLYACHTEGTQTVYRFWVSGSETAYPTYGQSRMRELLTAAIIYMYEHDALPPDLRTLYTDGYASPCTFYNPGDTDPAPTTIDNEIPNAPNSAQISFAFPAAGMSEYQILPNTIVLIDNTSANNAGLGRVVGYGDGHVEFVPDYPHPFAAMLADLGPCTSFTIRRGAAASEPYNLTLTPDIAGSAQAAPHYCELSAGGEITPEVLALFAAEGFDATNRVAHSASSMLLARSVRLLGPAGPAPSVVAYFRIHGVLVLAPRTSTDNAMLMGTWAWQDAENSNKQNDTFMVALRDWGLLALGTSGANMSGLPALYEIRRLGPGDAGYVDGAECVLVDGVSQRTVPILVGVEGTPYIHLTASTNQIITPASTTGFPAYSTFDVELPHAPAIEQVQLYAPPGYQLSISASYNQPNDTIGLYLRGDYDRDGDVDDADRAALAAGFSGPIGRPTFTPPDFAYAHVFDFDGDGDIDCDDYAAFTAAWTGGGSPAPLPACNPAMYTISVDIAGQGSVQRNPPDNLLPAGTPVQLTAIAAPGWSLRQWGGDASGEALVTTVVITADTHVLAAFKNECDTAYGSVGFSQPPIATTDPNSAPVAMPGSILGPRGVADRFVLPTTTAVPAVRWWGTYRSFLGQPAESTDNFTVNIRVDSAGAPGPVLSTYPLGSSPLRERTGGTMTWPVFGIGTAWFGEYEYLAVLDPPFMASAGSYYWLEILNTPAPLGGVPVMWAWRVGVGDGSCYLDYQLDGYDDSDLETGDMAFELVAPLPPTPDCNGNGVADGCDIAMGTSADVNGNRVPDECETWDCDVNGDGHVNFADVDALLGCLAGPENPNGGCPPEFFTASDADLDADVDLRDVAAMQVCLGENYAWDCDVNGDRWVNFADADALLECLAGPGNPNNGCSFEVFTASDADLDADVDLQDAAAMQVCLSDTYNTWDCDVNNDSQMDFADADALLECLVGPDNPNGGCSPEFFAASDADLDADVDLLDEAALQVCLSG